jgi:hypothetical protein
MFLIGAGCADAQGHPRRVRPQAQVPQEIVASFEATGRGDTWDDAYNFALKDAQTKIAAWAVADDPSLHWKPSMSLVQKLVKRQDRGDRDVEPVGLLREVSLQVDVTQSDLQTIQQEVREFRSTQRMLFLGKILAGLVAFFAAVAGYFRLEEATKGYYTNWLRLGALGFVTAVGVALFLVS